MREGHHKIPYRPMPGNHRFGLFAGILHHENCYTGDELRFREQVLAARKASGLAVELLETADSWFDPNQEIAFVNANADSWVFGMELRPVHSLSESDFHIGLVASERLHWQGMSALMRTIGDYLIIRNSELPEEQFNQPVNYVLLDVVRMLKQLAMTDNAKFVSKQIRLLHQYMRQVEIHVTWFEGSDRLFFADCRHTLEFSVEAELNRTIHNNLFRDQFVQLKKKLNHLGEMRHTLLHYSLTGKHVNPHPYWETFSGSLAASSSSTSFPVLAARSCVRGGARLKLTDSSAKEDLENCQGVAFIDSLSRETKTAYGQGVSDLEEILHFDTILSDLIYLFDQAGEVLTLNMFRQQITDFLQEVQAFIVRSQKDISHVQTANSKAYHQMIQAKQDLRWWDSLLGNQETVIKQFISNQDNLARFAVSPSDFEAVNSDFTEHVEQIINQLKQSGLSSVERDLIDATRQQVETLMISMHAWIGQQRAIQGMPYPQRSPVLIEAVPVEKPVMVQEHTWSGPQFWSQALLPSTGSTRVDYPAIDSCHSQLFPSDCPKNQSECIEAQAVYPVFFLSVLVLIPVSLLLLLWIYDRCRRVEPAGTPPLAYSNLIHLVEDKLAILSHTMEDEFSEFALMLRRLKSQAQTGVYDVKAMKKLLNNIDMCLLEPTVASSNSYRTG